tara:strand:+ start:1125 stop:1721 length:597 start_codon:yes stop_codon:yes gene_type:complete
MVTKSKQVEVVIQPIELATMQIKLNGETPFLMQKLSSTIRQQLIDMQTGKGKEKNKNRDLKKEVEDKIHRLENGDVAFPSSGFKKAMVEVAPYLDGMDKKKAKGSFNIIGELIPLKYKKMVVNKAVGRDSGINRAPREIWRPEFRDWSCVLTIKYNASQITPTAIVELAKLAGFHIGVGSWTMQHGGQYGAFTVGANK